MQQISDTTTQLCTHGTLKTINGMVHQKFARDCPECRWEDVRMRIQNIESAVQGHNNMYDSAFPSVDKPSTLDEQRLTNIEDRLGWAETRMKTIEGQRNTTVQINTKVTAALSKRMYAIENRSLIKLAEDRPAKSLLRSSADTATGKKKK